MLISGIMLALAAVRDSNDKPFLDATALATIGLFGITAYFAWQNRAMARAMDETTRVAKKDLAASEKLVQGSQQTIVEMRRDREAAYRPWLVMARVRVGEDTTGKYRARIYFVVKNIGTGPAVNIALCRRDDIGLLSSHEVQGLRAGEEVRFETAPEPDFGQGGRFKCIVDDWEPVEEVDVMVARYDDWFGTHYRSPGGPLQLSPNVWREDDGTPKPSWMGCQ
jgi:hypothetical protein